MLARRRFWILISPVLLTTLSGCGVWDAWRERHDLMHPSQTACNNDESYPYQGIQPGHSTDSDRYNSDYLPYSETPMDYGPTEHVSPPPVPPANANATNAQLQPAAESENKLIKTLKSPRIFAPDSVRSIYDRIRGSEGEQPATPKPTGPIAQNHIQESPTRACQYSSEEETGESFEGPVELGLPQTVPNPETVVIPEKYDRAPRQEITPGVSPIAAPTFAAPRLPNVMQAGPSSYKHPLLADPTGVPYGQQ